MTLRGKPHLRLLRDLTDGQDLIEYALLIALISTTVLITVTQLGVKVPGMYTTTADALPGDGGQEPTDGGPGNGNPGGGNPGGGNPGGGNPGGGNPGGGNPGGGNPGGGNPGGGNPGGGNPGK